MSHAFCVDARFTAPFATCCRPLLFATDSNLWLCDWEGGLPLPARWPRCAALGAVDYMFRRHSGCSAPETGPNRDVVLGSMGRCVKDSRRSNFDKICVVWSNFYSKAWGGRSEQGLPLTSVAQLSTLILQAYLTEIPWGLESTSRTYFGLQPQGKPSRNPGN